MLTTTIGFAARRGRNLVLIAVALVTLAVVGAPVPANAEYNRYMVLDGATGYARGDGTSMGSGDFEIVFWAAATDWSRSQRQTVFAKWSGTAAGNGLRVQYDTVGNLQLVVKDRSGNDHVYNAGEEYLDQSAGKGRWYRIRFDASRDGGTKSSITVWESRAAITTKLEDVTWGTPVARDVRPGAVALAEKAWSAWLVGARNDGTVDPFRGKIAYAHFIPNGYSSDGKKPTVAIDFRYRWRGSERYKPYDTWANAGRADTVWRMAGSKWTYVGGESSSGGSSDWTSGAPSKLRNTDNTAGALDFSENGKIMVVQQTAASLTPHATMFHTRSGYSSWGEKFDNEPQPTLKEVIETVNGENVALRPDGGRVYVAPEGNAGTDWGMVYSYAIDVNISTNEVKTDGRKRREYNAASLAKVKRGLSGMWVSRKNPGVHWFVVDHTYESPDGYTLFAIDSKNKKLLWRGKFDESGSGGAIRDWRDVEDLTGYKADGVSYLEIWDNGTDQTYRFREPSLTLGQTRVSRSGLKPSRIMEIQGGVVGSGNVEAMAYNPAENAMYWVGPRGSDSSDHDNKREVRKVTRWSSRSNGAEPYALLVGKIINRPR